MSLIPRLFILIQAPQHVLAHIPVCEHYRSYDSLVQCAGCFVSLYTVYKHTSMVMAFWVDKGSQLTILSNFKLPESLT